MPFIAWRKNKEGEWQTEYWYSDGMDGGEQREKDLAEDLEEQGVEATYIDLAYEQFRKLRNPCD